MTIEAKQETQIELLKEVVKGLATLAQLFGTTVCGTGEATKKTAKPEAEAAPQAQATAPAEPVAQVPAAPAPTPAAEPTPAPAPAAESTVVPTPNAATEPTWDDVVLKFRNLNSAKGSAAVRALMTQFKPDAAKVLDLQALNKNLEIVTAIDKAIAGEDLGL